MGRDFVERVAAALQEVSASITEPRFANLREGDVHGRNTMWLVVFLTVLAGYLTALDRVRTREDGR